GDDNLTVNSGTLTLQLVNTEHLQILQGTVTLDANAAVNTFLMNGGTLTGRRGLSIHQDGIWNGGTWDGAGNALVAVVPNAAFEIAGPDPKRMVNYELFNQGTVNWVGDSAVTAVTARLINEGAFNLQGRARLLADGQTRFSNALSATLEKRDDGIATFN